MDPKSQGNPYLDMLARGGPQGSGPNPMAAMAASLQSGGQPAQAGQVQPGAQQGPQGADVGAPGGNTKPLISAVQALHTFTVQGSDPQEIAVVRSMIVILNQLIMRDQAQQAQQGGGQPQAGGPPVGGPPGPQA